MRRVGLSSSVYLVYGSRGAAFYDLRHGRLFSVDADARVFLQCLLGSANPSTPESLEQRRFLRQLRRLGLLTWTDSVSSHQITELKQPVNLSMAWIEVCKGCNLRCVHCYNSDSPNDSPSDSRMSLDAFAFAVAQIEEAGIETIQLIGGEPLVLGETLERMLRHCHGKFRKVQLFTNATLMTPEWARFFRTHDIEVLTTVFSYSADDHDRVTQVPGSHKRTNEAFQMFRDERAKFKVFCVYGLKGVGLGTRSTDLYRLETARSAPKMTGRASLHLLDAPTVFRKLITKSSFSRPLDAQKVARQVSGHNCFASRVYVDTQLHVYPCVMERRFKHGDLRNGRLVEILRSDLLGLTKDGISGCSKCEFRYACFDCRPDCNGSPEFSKPWYCTYDPDEGRWEETGKFVSRLLATQQIRKETLPDGDRRPR